jgi:hypothetical protein
LGELDTRSFSKDIAKNFISGIDNAVILILTPNSEIIGVKNEYGMNDEEEFILYPCKLKVIDKKIEKNNDGSNNIIIYLDYC